MVRTDIERDADGNRIGSEMIDRFRAGGPGWQGRINEALRKAVGL